MTYASFWQRFAAMWIDFFVLLPVVVLQGVLGSYSKTVGLLLVIPASTVFVAYSIYYHGRFGQTVGKRLMGVRVVRTNGDRIGWREAWLRSSLDVLFAVLGVIESLVALATIPDAEYYGVGWSQRMANLAAHHPSWLGWVATATQVWVWSEVVVMLFNRQRRAVHDFIAGTVVISEVTVADAQTQTA